MQLTTEITSLCWKIFILLVIISITDGHWFWRRRRGNRRRRTVQPEKNVDCVMNSWSKWSECSNVCSRGVRDRHRTIKTRPSGLGTSCPYNYDEEDCGVPNGGCSDYCDPSKTPDKCYCRKNRVLRADKKTCVQQNKCVTNGGRGDCEQICDPNRGCKCKQGYQLGTDKKSCHKLDCKEPVFPDCRPGSYFDNFGPVCNKVQFKCQSGTGYRDKCLLSCPKGFGLIISYRNKKPYLKNYSPLEFEHVPHTISCNMDRWGSPYWSNQGDFSRMYCRRTNDPPEDIALSNNNMQEHDQLGTVIGRLTSHDPQFTQSIAFSIQPTFDGNLFDVKNSRLVSNWVPSKIGPQDKFYTVEIKATDNDKFKPMYLIQKFQIVVRNVNDPPYGVQLSKTSISENAPSGTVVGTLSALDIDGPGLGKRSPDFIWRLVDSSNGKFSLIGATILVGQPLQAYSNQVLVISVWAKDKDPRHPLRSPTTQIPINVMSINKPPTSLTFQYGQLFENHPVNTAVGTLTAIDKYTDPISFDINSSDQSVKDYFQLGITTCRTSTTLSGKSNVCSATVVLHKQLDYEKVSKYTLKVTAKDKKGRAVSKEFEIEVRDVNEPPSAISLSSNEVLENSQPNVVIASIKVVDPDNELTPRQKHSCSLKDTPNNPFKISQLNILVKDGAKIDYEAVINHQYKISVTCRDITPSPLSLTKDFVIKIKDVNEAPSNLRLSNKTVLEDAPKGHVIGTLSADDEDLGPNVLKFETVNSTSPLVVVGGKNGNELILQDTLDYETERMFDVVVKVTDIGGLSDEKIFQIQVKDVNEAPIDVKLLYHNMTEDSPPNTLVTAVEVIDPDKDATYSCTVVNPNAGYLYYSNKGLYATTKSVNYEAIPGHQFKLHLNCTDNGGLSLTKFFTISVIDINEQASSVTVTSQKVPENEAMATVGQITVIDTDINQRHTCEVLANEKTHADFEVDAKTLKIKTKSSLNFELYNSYNVRVRCLDQPEESWQKKYYKSTSLKLYVLDKNERPNTPCQSRVYVSDKATNGSVVHKFLAYDPDNEAYHRRIARGDPKSLIQPKQKLTYSIYKNSSSDLPFDVVGDQYLMMKKKLQRGQIVKFNVKVSDDGTILTYTEENKLQYTKASALHGDFACEAEVLPDTDPRLAPDIILTSNRVSEKAANGTVVGEIRFADTKSRQGYTFTLPDDSTPFSLNGSELIVSNAKLLNYEVVKMFQIMILVTDTKGVARAKTFVIHVTVAGCNQNSVARDGVCVCKSGYHGQKCDRTNICTTITCKQNHVCVSVIPFVKDRCCDIVYQVPILINQSFSVVYANGKVKVYQLEILVEEILEDRSGNKNLGSLFPASSKRKRRALPSDVYVESTGETPIGEEYTYLIMVIMDPSKGYEPLPSADLCQKLSSSGDKGIRCVNAQDCEILKRYNVPCPYGSGGLGTSKSKEKEEAPAVLKEPAKISLIVLGFIVLAVVAVAGICFIRRRKRSKEKEASRPFDDRINIAQGTHQNPVYGTPDLADDNRRNGPIMSNNFAQPAPLDNRHDVKRFTNNLYANVSNTPHDFSNPVYGASPPPAYSQVVESPVYESVGFKGGKKFQKEVVDLPEGNFDLKKGTTDKPTGNKPSNIGISNKAYEFDDLKKEGQSKA